MNATVLPERPRLARLFRLQYEPVQTAWVLLYPEGMVKLNDSAGAIASLIDGRRSVAAIVAELEARYPGVAELGDESAVELVGLEIFQNGKHTIKTADGKTRQIALESYVRIVHLGINARCVGCGWIQVGVEPS